MHLVTEHLIVKGKVQGVFYRKNTLAQAKVIGVTGYVKNLPDGNVEIVATGTIEQINALKAWCKKGPDRAEVTSIETETISFKNFEKFSIL